MDINERVKALNTERLKVWEEAKGLLEQTNGRAMSAEEQAKWDGMNADLDARAAEVDRMTTAEKREREAGQLREMEHEVFPAATVTNRYVDADRELRSWLRGESRKDVVNDDGQRVNGWVANIRGARKEREMLRQGASAEEIRAIAWDTGSVASAVPTILDRTLYETLEASIAAFRMPVTYLNTESGAPMDFPKTNAHAIATQVSGQGTTLAGTDPTFLKTTLTPGKYAELVKVANEVLTDAGIDIAAFVSRDIGRAIGRLIDADAVAGTGVFGGMLAITGAGTIATGGSLIDPSYEKLVDLVYSVNDEYRSGGAAAFLMRDATAGVLRKLRDGAGGTVGAVLWDPSLTNGIQGGQPDRLLGFPVYTDPNVASLASNAVVMAFGDWRAYYFRTVGNLMVERNDSVGFATDEAFFRGKWRADGAIIDTTAINIMKRSV